MAVRKTRGPTYCFEQDEGKKYTRPTGRGFFLLQDCRISGHLQEEERVKRTEYESDGFFLYEYEHGSATGPDPHG